MFNLLLIFFIISLLGGLISTNHKNQNYLFMDRELSDTLHGIAIIMIVLAHIFAQNDDVIKAIVGGRYILTVVGSWGAVGVAIFFFPSGYGNEISISKISNKKMYAK